MAPEIPIRKPCSRDAQTVTWTRQGGYTYQREDFTAAHLTMDGERTLCGKSILQDTVTDHSSLRNPMWPTCRVCISAQRKMEEQEDRVVRRVEAKIRQALLDNASVELSPQDLAAVFPDDWQDDRIYTNNERQLDTRIDCHIGRRKAA